MLGAGAMGSRLAQNFLKAGHTVTIYNRSPERVTNLAAEGATLATTPREAVAGAEFVIGMVRDDAASRAVWTAENTGAIYGLTPGVLTIESSTLTPDWIKELSAEIAKSGAEFLEAPVLGTRPQAENGQLVYLVGGESATLERAKPILQINAAAIHHVGGVGMSAALKLAINAQYGVQVAIWAETLALLAKQGIETQKAVEIINTLPTTSPALQVGGKLMAAQNYAPMFPIELVEKDFGYALAMAKAIGASTPTLETVHALYAAAIEKGYGDSNIVGVRQLFD
jgi:3-hydroxyisobutyrate dehydrogenase